MNENLNVIQRSLSDKNGYAISSLRDDKYSDVITLVFNTPETKEAFKEGNILWTRCRETVPEITFLNDEDDNYSGYGVLGEHIAVADLMFPIKDAVKNEATFYRNRINQSFLKWTKSNNGKTILDGQFLEDDYAQSSLIRILERAYNDDEELINTITSIAELPDTVRETDDSALNEFFIIIYDMYTEWWENLCNYKKTLEYADTVEDIGNEIVFTYKNAERWFFYQDVDTGDGSKDHEENIYNIKYR